MRWRCSSSVVRLRFGLRSISLASAAEIMSEFTVVSPGQPLHRARCTGSTPCRPDPVPCRFGLRRVSVPMIVNGAPLTITVEPIGDWPPGNSSLYDGRAEDGDLWRSMRRRIRRENRAGCDRPGADERVGRRHPAHGGLPVVLAGHDLRAQGHDGRDAGNARKFCDGETVGRSQRRCGAEAAAGAALGEAPRLNDDQIRLPGYRCCSARRYVRRRRLRPSRSRRQRR